MLTQNAWCAAAVLAVASGGCGLLLEPARAPDAAIQADASGMDARVLDAATLPEADGGNDAFENVTVHDGFILPELDAPVSPPDGAVSIPDAFSTPDAPRPIDAAVLDASRHDAGRDASDCPATCDPLYAYSAAGASCTTTTCVGGRCLASTDTITCPPAGTCARPCELNASSGDLTCVREGTGCSPLFGACDLDGMCRSGLFCADLSGCPANLCLPGCRSAEIGMTCTIVGDGGMISTGTCNGRVCVPSSVRPSWCTGP